MEKWVIMLIWISILIVPVIFIIMGLILWKKTPKPNTILGYRNKKTLSNDKIWYYANQLYGIIAVIAGIIDLLILIPMLILSIPNHLLALLIVFLIVITASIVIPILIVEREIK
ncbi:MAG: SdpI family protein [Acholeplasmataceae bacterium]|jgi:uncharacterized membrane protein